MSAPFQEILVARSLSFIILWSIWVMVWSARCPLGFTTTTLTSDSDKFDLLINFIQTRGSCLISPFLGLYLFSTKVQRWVARTQMACSLTSSNSHSLNKFIMIHTCTISRYWRPWKIRVETPVETWNCESYFCIFGYADSAQSLRARALCTMATSALKASTKPIFYSYLLYFVSASIWMCVAFSHKFDDSIFE